MKNIDKITKENFNESFNIADILSDSVFYPAAGIDARDIECLSNLSNSFVHVDYSNQKEVIELSKQFCFSVPLVFPFFNEMHVGQLIKFQSDGVAANVQLLF